MVDEIVDTSSKISSTLFFDSIKSQLDNFTIPPVPTGTKIYIDEALMIASLIDEKIYQLREYTRYITKPNVYYVNP